MVHLFRFDPLAVAVPPQGQKLGEKYRVGAWKCVMCRMLMGFAVTWDLLRPGDCTGLVRSA